MPSKKRSLLAASGAGDAPLYVEDVFSTYVYTGTGSTRSIVNGLDLDGEGGLTWVKRRTNGSFNHTLLDTERSASGGYNSLATNSTAAENFTYGWAFNSDGFTINGGGGTTNVLNEDYASWSFRKAEKFFDVVEFEAPTSASDNFRVSHNLGSVPACIIVKSVDVTGDWYVYHSSLDTPRNDSLKLNTTAASAGSGDFWGEANPTTTDFGVQVRNFGTRPVTTSAGTYIAYLFASDAGGFGDDEDENIVKCGSFSGIGQVNLGFEPQFLLYKPHSQTANWELADNMRRLDGVSSSVLKLEPNSDAAEANGSEIKINATGFYNGTFGSSYPCIYMAIRRPMKVPTAGTEVFSPVARTGTGTTAAVTGVGFSPDLFIGNIRDTAGYWNGVVDRLRGIPKRLVSSQTEAENTQTVITSFDMDGLSLTSDSNGFANENGKTYIQWLFKRAAGFMDVVAYSGTGATSGSPNTHNHNLVVAPELIICKNRTTAGSNWFVYVSALGENKGLLLNLTLAELGYNIGFKNIGASTFQTFDSNDTNSANFIAYLFATVAGVSKVGSYTGTGSNVDVDCGFSAGARFILIKRTDSTGDWYVYDSARGIVVGNDPYLLMNSTAAEVTNTDYIDPLSAGFTVTSSAPAALNASGGTYIFLAIA